MPFVLMCGFPCSGKSSLTKQLKCYFEEKNLNVNVISEEDFEVDKNNVYADSQKEKQLRGNLKSAAQRAINTKDVVILDSGNYIKGYRYELYCVTKSAQTPQCVIHCDVSHDTSSEWNQARPEEQRYSQDILDALVMRFEAPQSRNRWDSPLFIVQGDDKLPCEEIDDALFLRKAPPPNLSTISQPLSSGNFLHDLDRITKSVMSAIMDAQKTSIPGDAIGVPVATLKLQLRHTFTLAELQRLRRQFISFTKTHPVDDPKQIANTFVQFLNNSSK